MTDSLPRPLRLGFLTTHPVQYTAPLFRRLAAEPDLELTVLYQTALSAGSFRDPGFGRTITWDVPLLDGYASRVLPQWGGRGEGGGIGLWRPFPRRLLAEMRAERFDALIIHGYSRPAHWLAVLAARAAGSRVLIRDEATLISKRRGPVKRLLKRLFFAGLDALADGFLAIGRLNAAYYRAHGIADARIHLTPYAVDNAFFQAVDHEGARRLRTEYAIPAEAPVILYASKLERRKHADHLLAAFQRLPADLPRRPHLVLVGDGELLGDLRAAATGRADVHFLGFRGQRELLACYGLADLFVLPSSFETWGLVVNEAMAAGLPVVVSDQVGCAADLVEDGGNGRVVPAGDVAALAGALADLCRDPERRRAMGARSRAIIAGWDYEADVAGIRAALGLPPRPARPPGPDSSPQEKSWL